MTRLQKLLPLFLLLLLLAACNDPSPSGETDTTNDDVSTQQESPPPVVTQLNYYVTAADRLAYLSDAELANFEKLVDAVLMQEEHVTLSNDYDSNLRVFGALQANPFYFFVSDLSFTDDHSGVILEYGYTPQDQQAMLNYITEEYIRILGEIIHPDMNELDQVLAVYHYFAARISYNYDWLEALDASDEKFLFPDIAIYEALTTDRGVCHSYAYLCEFALQQLGIECLPVNGEMSATPDVGHMWLVVRIDGEYYHLDPTWDSIGDGAVSLTYFGMSDQERYDSGVENWSLSYDAAYGEVYCSDESFLPLRAVQNFSFPQPWDGSHRILLELISGSEAEYNTQTKQLS